MNAKESLITSTQALLWERGYVGMSPNAILRRAGAGQGSMYHHFAGKAELALAAIERSAEELRALMERPLSAEGTAVSRITAFLLRERDVLRGCRIGRLAQDPDVVANAALRQPINETFEVVKRRLAEVLELGVARKELRAELNAADTAAMILAVLQGGYVLARAADSVEPFDHAIKGALSLLRLMALEQDGPTSQGE
ncbi:TetR/AcrR family transcriptional regulator [Jeongeupia wiesaeckerbachi]|uniref:TetR/AcrR family transcriptional regulator n=1 Tax=Jeongeupia wiesaeckerbachi TaxID=3051218 RepID=UPI003D80549B